MSRFFFFATKEDFLTSVKELEDRIGGLIYVLDDLYTKPEAIVYNSITEIPGIGYNWSGDHKKFSWKLINKYLIFRKDYKLEYSSYTIESGERVYKASSEFDAVLFDDFGGVELENLETEELKEYKGKYIVRCSEINTTSYPTEESVSLYKEVKKAFTAFMRKREEFYYGNSLIKNPDKYIASLARIENEALHLDLKSLKVKRSNNKRLLEMEEVKAKEVDTKKIRKQFVNRILGLNANEKWGDKECENTCCYSYSALLRTVKRISTKLYLMAKKMLLK